MNESCCHGLKKNKGLYTQCEGKKVSESEYCRTCLTQSSKNANGKPNSGTIEDRMSCGIMEFKPQDGKLVSFAKLMRSQKLTRSQVESEALEAGIVINSVHFEEESEEVDKKKGRPKKAKKVLEVSQVPDVFAELIASSSASASSESASSESASSESESSESESESEKKNEKKEKNEMKEADKESKVIEKSLKKEAEKKKKEELKKAKEEAEKKKKEELKKAKEEDEKKKKEELKKAKEEKKKEEVVKSNKKEEEPIKVVIINSSGQTKKTGLKEGDKKYLRSTTGDILDFTTQELIGKWNAEGACIDFNEDYVESDEENEEEEEDYEE